MIIDYVRETLRYSCPLQAWLCKLGKVEGLGLARFVETLFKLGKVMMRLTCALHAPYMRMTGSAQRCAAEGAVCVNDRQHVDDLLGSMVLNVNHSLAVLTPPC